jgi:hypothetical protein
MIFSNQPPCPYQNLFSIESIGACALLWSRERTRQRWMVPRGASGPCPAWVENRSLRPTAFGAKRTFANDRRPFLPDSCSAAKLVFCLATQAGLFYPRALGQSAMRSHWGAARKLGAPHDRRSNSSCVSHGGQYYGDLVALFDRLRSLPEPGDGVTVVPHAEAFGGAVQDLPQPSRKAQTGR